MRDQVYRPLSTVQVPRRNFSTDDVAKAIVGGG